MYLHLEIEFTHNDLFKAAHWKVCEAYHKTGIYLKSVLIQHCRPL